jgi:hypothetical protein
VEHDPIAATGATEARYARGPLLASAVIEMVSLAVLLVNMATADAGGVAALVGPVHGIAWLFGIITVWRDPGRTTGIAVLAAIPGVGGVLALRALTRAGRREGAHDDIA